MRLLRTIILTTVCLILIIEIHGENVTGGMQSAEDRSFKTTTLEVIGRTFGRIKKMQMALLPVVYKLGIISAVILMTFFLAFKGVLIGTLILMLNIAFFALKIGAYFKSDYSHTHSLNGWQPPKDIHLHVHSAHSKNDYTGAYNTIDASNQYWNTPSTWDNQRQRASFGRELFFGENKRNVTHHSRKSRKQRMRAGI